MADFNKIGVLILNEDATKFLVCEVHPRVLPPTYLMPGGVFHEDSIEECIANEIKEELDSAVDTSTIEFIGEYIDVAATNPDKTVAIQLYKGALLNEPKPSSEVKQLHWIGKEGENLEVVSPIIRNKIIPDLIKRGILK
ncbi:MAG: NUDIX domain-containing protein [Patescibacteria group bacterium]|jgi:hypothetical protein